MDEFGLNVETIKLINDFFASVPEVKEVRIFGSRAKGNFKPSSGIDFVLRGEITPKLLRHIAFELDELSTPYSFDVVDFNGIENADLKKNIQEHSKIFYTR